jgi:PAS domain S-box-containing protein
MNENVPRGEEVLGMDNRAETSGVLPLGGVPWGTHFCQFYQNKEDLLDTLIPYFESGLENNEFCLWVCSEPLCAEKAKKALGKAMPGFATRVKNGQIEVLPHTEWYLKRGRFSSQRVLRDWADKLAQALARGFDGMRFSGNTFWLEKKDWQRFTDYEREVNSLISQYRMIMLCTYSIDRCGIDEIIDVVNNHQSTLIRRMRKWTVAENSSFRKRQEDLRQSERTLQKACAESETRTEERTTELGKADQELSREFAECQNEELLRNVLDALPVGVWTIDRQGKIIYGNPAGREIWGGARYVGLERFGEYKGRWLNTGKPIAPEEWAGARAIQKGETSINEEIEIEAFDGKRKIIRNSAIPIRNAKKKVTGAILVNQDITDEVRLQRHVRQQQKLEALGTLAGGIAHDFNNILMPIIINTEMELLEAKKESPSARSLKLILEAAKRGKELVRLIITYSRQKEQERRPVDVTQLVQEALELLRSSVSGNIQIREVLDAGSAVCLADPTQIRPVVMNLCHNAAYAMRDKGGILDVKIERLELPQDSSTSRLDLKPGSYIKLSVSDCGQGMSQEVMERAFDPFFATKKPGEGTGMGLPVALGIVKSHGGTITLTSQLGKGSIFQVYLPRIEAANESRDPAAVSIPTGKERILFVDDEDLQVRTMTAMLKLLGYRAVGKTDAQKALREFRRRPNAFDLVMTDQNMPRLTGEKLAGEILRLRPDIPVILCTGYSERVNEETAKAMGIRELVMKPFSLQEIASTIRRVLDS